MRSKSTVRYSVIVFAVFMAASFCLPSLVQALTIVDTGISSTSGVTGYVLSSSQSRQSYSSYRSANWLSAEFNVAQESTITDIQGWMSLRASYIPYGQSTYGNTFAIAIYGDGGDVPNVSNRLLYEMFTIDRSTVNVADWRGLSGLSLDLAAGDYWVAFEVPAFVNGLANNTWGIMPNYPVVPNPLNNAAYLSSYYGNVWQASDSTKFGVRILALDPPTSVPEPATMLLLGLGLVGLVRVSRKLKK